MDKREEIISLLREQNKRLSAVQKILIDIDCHIDKGGVSPVDEWGNSLGEKY